uniref:K Homology domain-containing protein n=1 Tax=Meloidogyne javanica TaxID=6303 RepID=A0A915LY59_MELJA
MDFIDLVESSPEPYDDHRTSAFQMEGSRTVKSERSDEQSSLTVPGGFGFARSRGSRIDDYTDSFGRVESTQFFNRSTNGTRFFENRLSEGGGRENRGVFERGRKLVSCGSERGEGYENQDVGGGFFSSGLNLQLLHRVRSARHADNNDLSQSATIESSMKRQSLPIIYGTRKRQFFDDPPVSIKRTIGSNSLQTNESHMSLAAKQPRFSFTIPLSDRYESEMIPTVSPLEKESKVLAFEMRQETNFINSLDDPINVNLNHSKRLLNTEINKLEESFNTEWLELDNKRIRICRYVLVPTYRYPKINFVGRLIGVKGLTLQKICKKYKCFLSIQGAHSTKDRTQEIELLSSGDPRYAHFAGPLHVRVDVYSVPHIAHMRMAAVLNLLHKAFIPVI